MDKNIRDLLTARGLASHMNDTKWRELCIAVDQLPFAPAYQRKLLREQEPYPAVLEDDPTYLGDWAKTAEAALGVEVEWIKVAPRYRRRGTGLNDCPIDDCSDQFRSMLKRLRVPFVETGGFYTIYGHSGAIAFD